jgi:hypothetical protein
VETPQQSDEGYPEEQPDDVAPDSGHEPPEDDESRDDDSQSRPDTATGNPRS